MSRELYGGVQQEQQLSFFAGSLGDNFSRGLRRRMKEAFEPAMKADRLTNVDSDKAGAAMKQLCAINSKSKNINTN